MVMLQNEDTDVKLAVEKLGEYYSMLLSLIFFINSVHFNFFLLEKK